MGEGRHARFFEHLVDGLAEGVMLVDDDGVILWASHGLGALLGQTPEEIVGRTIFDLQHPDDAELSRARRADPNTRHWHAWHATRRVRHADGTFRLLDCTSTNLTDDPEVGGTAVTLRESSSRHQAWETERRLRAMVERAADAVVVYGRDLSVVYCSPSATELLGDLTGTLLEHIQRFIDPDHVREAIAAYTHAVQRPGVTVEVEAPLVLQGGQTRWVELKATNLLDDPAVSGMVVNARDVTAETLLRHRLTEAARRDPLTGLPNRTDMLELLGNALRDATPEAPVAMLFLDLDRFKVVNDSFGHGTGDRVLIDLGWRLRQTIGRRGTVGRFGGDEYVVLAGVTGPGAALDLAQLMLRVAAEPVTVVGPDDEQAEVFLSGSVGIALGSAGADPPSLLHHADAAMYRAKARGRGAAELYDETMRQESRARLALEADLAHALRDGGFELHFQPIVEVTRQSPTGFEALARWPHAERGLVSPVDFIPIAEDTGGIHRLGNWALVTGCLAVQRWRAEHGVPLAVSVNLSPRQLSRDTLADDVASVLDRTGVDPTAVTLEITETLLMEDLDAAVKALSRLRDVGVRLALDDFGTGWSSLTYLQSVPVDIVKIDRSFIQGVADSRDDRAIVGSVVGMCRALEKDVVAEGVETEAQLEALADLGCTHAQGYLFSPALAADAVAGWLQAHLVPET